MLELPACHLSRRGLQVDGLRPADRHRGVEDDDRDLRTARDVPRMPGIRSRNPVEVGVPVVRVPHGRSPGAPMCVRGGQRHVEVGVHGLPAELGIRDFLGHRRHPIGRQRRVERPRRRLPVQRGPPPSRRRRPRSLSLTRQRSSSPVPVAGASASLSGWAGHGQDSPLEEQVEEAEGPLPMLRLRVLRSYPSEARRRSR